MNLFDYLQSSGVSQSSIAFAIGAHSPDVSRWAAGLRAVPNERCAAIEQLTAGVVTCEEMRPDIAWVRVPDPAWPHPGGRPAIDVSAAPIST